MRNPCDKCLVLACCTDVCQNKYDYTEKVLNKLSSIGAFIYDDRGAVENIPERILKRWQIWLDICEKNRVEIGTIHYRSFFKN